VRNHIIPWGDYFSNNQTMLMYLLKLQFFLRWHERLLGLLKPYQINITIFCPRQKDCVMKYSIVFLATTPWVVRKVCWPVGRLQCILQWRCKPRTSINCNNTLWGIFTTTSIHNKRRSFSSNVLYNGVQFQEDWRMFKILDRRFVWEIASVDNQW
jgi:hypothetical protein